MGIWTSLTYTNEGDSGGLRLRGLLEAQNQERNECQQSDGCGLESREN